jgi:two-component system, chemotaxis family, response regulator Rcp1
MHGGAPHLGPQQKSIGILLVDDNPGDIVLTKELLSETKVSNHVHVAFNGTTALQFLRKEGSCCDAPSIDLVLLDINMPVMNGLEMLKEMRSDLHLRNMPVIILTSSDAEEDIRGSYDLHANGYVVKTGELEEYYRIIRSIEDFWLTTVRFPRRSERP